MAKPKQLQMAYDAQDYTFNSLKAYYTSLLDENGKPCVQKEDAMAIAQLTRAFEIAQERVRICRKTPLPGVVKHEAKPKRGKHAQVLVLEPMSEAGESSDSAGNQPDTQDDKQGESAGVQAS